MRLELTHKFCGGAENITQDEREHLLSTVGQAHAGLSEVALKLRLGLPPETPVLKTAIKAEPQALGARQEFPLSGEELDHAQTDCRQGGAPPR